MSVKRPYTSQLRAEQARDTRRAIVSAAARLFVQDGFGRTTVDAIATEAGVSRKTVFTAVGGKLEMLKLALDWAIVGDDQPVPLAERAEIHQLAGETDPAAILQGWVDIVTPIAARVAGLSGALTAAAGLDPEAKALWERGQAQRLAGARAFIGHLSAHTQLRPGLTRADAADITWLHSDPALYNRLVLQRRWSNRHFKSWLHQTMTLQLLD
jgi:AcrR family transcriptional regulator